MKLTPAKLSVVPVVVVLTALLVCRPPEPAAPLPSPDADPEAAALAATWPDVVPLRMLAKERIAREVLAGCRSLLEAAALFRELNRLPPAVWNMPPDWYDSSVPIPVRTADEGLCWQVAAQAVAALRDAPPAQVQEAVARLAGEFQEELQRSGAIRLPDADTLPSARELLARAWDELTDEQKNAILGSRQGGP
jgi:hypothetical protein